MVRHHQVTFTNCPKKTYIDEKGGTYDSEQCNQQQHEMAIDVPRDISIIAILNIHILDCFSIAEKNHG